MSDYIKLSSPETQEYWEIPVLYEDEFLIALDKPALLPISPDQYDPTKANLMNLLHRDIEKGAQWVIKRRIAYLANTHRMDEKVSGAILLAKEKPVLINLANQFSAEKSSKSFQIIVRGSPSDEEFCIDSKIAPNPCRPGMMRIDQKQGKKSISLFVVKERFAGFTLLECKPLTERAHQMRVHLQHKRLRIVGDTQYGGSSLYLSDLKRNYRHKVEEKERPLIGRIAMHLERIEVIHPVNGISFIIQSPIPHDFQVALKYLRRFGLGN